MIIQEADHLRLETLDIRPATLNPLKFKNDEGLMFYSLTLKYTESISCWAHFIRFKERLSLYGMQYELLMVKAEQGEDTEFFLIVSSTSSLVMAYVELCDWGNAQVVYDTPNEIEVIQGKKMDLTTPGFN